MIPFLDSYFLHGFGLDSTSNIYSLYQVINSCYNSKNSIIEGHFWIPFSLGRIDMQDQKM